MEGFIASAVGIVHFYLNNLLTNKKFFCKSSMYQSISTAIVPDIVGEPVEKICF